MKFELIEDRIKVSPKDMKDGEIGIIREWNRMKEHIGVIVQKTRTGLIAIGKPSDYSWPNPDVLYESVFQIELLKPGDTLVITE
jgi:hypothetical protein